MRDLLPLAERALETAAARGASFADARAVRTRARSIEVKTGRVAGLSEAETTGVGVRCLADGAWGFAATSDLSLASLDACAAQAVAVARTSALFRAAPVALAPEAAHCADWVGPCAEDPFSVPVSEGAAILLDADARMRAEPGITMTQLFLRCGREEKAFANSAGARIAQTRTVTGGAMMAAAFRDGAYQQRSYPSSHGGLTRLGGFEVIRSMDLPANAARIASEAVALLTAPVCPEGVLDLVLMDDQLALQIHESCGHPIELDRVLGSEANFAGTSFLTPDRLGTLRYGSPRIQIVADATLAHGPGLGTFAFDDEGVEAQRTWIVRDGVFSGYLTSRETAATLALPRSGGTMRADAFHHLPLIRMTNVSLLPGEGSVDELISGVARGVLMQTNQSWSIDEKRLHFQFGCEIGWEIADGKRGRMVRRPTYAGITPQFWGSCDGIAGQAAWNLWGTTNCGKGQPLQVLGTGHGAAPARFRGVQIGVAG